MVDVVEVFLVNLLALLLPLMIPHCSKLWTPYLVFTWGWMIMLHNSTRLRGRLHTSSPVYTPPRGLELCTSSFVARSERIDFFWDLFYALTLIRLNCLDFFCFYLIGLDVCTSFTYLCIQNLFLYNISLPSISLIHLALPILWKEMRELLNVN